jgi:hypothetical protein
MQAHVAARTSAFRAAWVFALFALAGCATRRDVVVAKLRGRGTQRVYAVTVDQAWNISETILRLEPTEAIDEHRSEGYMLTSDSSSSFTPGTYMGVFVEADGPAATKVTFVTRRRTPTQAYAALTESGFHRKFSELLRLIAAVGPVASGPSGDDPGKSHPSGCSAAAPAGDGGAKTAACLTLPSSDAGTAPSPPTTPPEARGDGGS